MATLRGTDLLLCWYRGFFGKQDPFTSFFSRTGTSGGVSPGGEASIHGGAAGGFRQVRSAPQPAPPRTTG